MKVIVTGASGTVGSVLMNFLATKDHQATAWDRNKVAIDDYKAIKTFLQDIQPDTLFHLAMGSNDWTKDLATSTKELGIQFIYTSTVMVFTNDAKGPFTIASIPDAKEGYGHYKLEGEEVIKANNPNATIVRLGWQISKEPGSNNMVDFFDQQSKNGSVNASCKWYPACSFLEDTAAALVEICQKPSGLYLLNANSKWNFYQIACALNERHNHIWDVVSTKDFVYDQRMRDDRVKLPDLAVRLPQLEQNSEMANSKA